jgi:hypothetical protein
MDTMRSKTIIKYNGVDATEPISSDCDSFAWKDNADGTADTVTLSLDNQTRRWMNGYYPADTDTFKCWIQMSEWPVDDKDGKLYCGNFMVDSLKFSGFPEKVELSGISVPTDGNFNVKQKNKTWSKTTVKTILGDIAKDAGISLTYDAEDISVDSVKQTGKTDLAFAYSICSEYDLAIKLYNKKIVAYDKTRYEKKPAAFTIKPEDLGGNGAYSISRQVTTVYDSVKMQYTDGDSGNTLTYQYTVPGTSGKRQMFLTTKAESYSDAEKKSKAALRKNRREAQTATLKLIGSSKYEAAKNFDLSGFGELDGKYFIDRASHSKSGGKYTVTITAHLTVTNF